MIEELKIVLKKHHRLYPLMEIEDVIKLLFQSILGPRHLLIDKDKSLLWLKDEAKVNPNQNKEIIDIGNNFVRVNLINDDEYLNYVNNAFIKSCEVINIDLYKILFELKDFIVSEFKFNEKDYQDRILYLKNNSFLNVTHSKTYNENYHPFYRVINKKYL